MREMSSLSPAGVRNFSNRGIIDNNIVSLATKISALYVEEMIVHE